MDQTNENQFGSLLHELRTKLGKKKVEVAKAAGVTVMYYSDVEQGKRKPFPGKKVDYKELAKILQIDVDYLKQVAVAQRKELRFDLATTNEDVTFVVVALARKVSEGSLSQEQIKRLKEVLSLREGDAPEQLRWPFAACSQSQRPSYSEVTSQRNCSNSWNTLFRDSADGLQAAVRRLKDEMEGNHAIG